jgi:eukaryotic-like serine/threonine-protein kinase
LLVDAIQSGDADRQQELLRLHPHLFDWADCLKTLDRFAPCADAADFASTILEDRPVGWMPGQRASAGRFGKYDLLGEVGRGGMGVVYKAIQRDLNRIVALKMILASEWASAEEISRFQSEARAAARLKHRNIVGIYEVGEELGRHFFAMDFVEGESLAAVIARGILPAEQAAGWMVAIAQAVDHLHAQGLIHRDLKPSNILIDTSGEPMVTDFGLAKFFDSDAGATRSGAILGTPSYMSPEQAAGRNADVTIRSDVYSLGAVLYEMLSGRPPFREASPMDTLVQVLEGEPTLLRRLVKTIPPDLERICFKCLEKDPGRRYATAAELASDLTRFLRGESVEAQAGSLLQILERWVRRQPGLACRLAVLVPGIVIVQAYFQTSGTDWSYHLRVIALLMQWILMSICWQLLLGRERWAVVARLGTVVTDAGMLTGLFLLADDPQGMLVIVYAMVVVASGLWFQERLVLWATLITELAFGVLLAARPELRTPWHYPVLAGLTLLVIGAAIRFQVHRVRALSRFYERRPL